LIDLISLCVEIPVLIFTLAMFVAAVIKKNKHNHQKILTCLIFLILSDLFIDILLCAASFYDKIMPYYKEMLDAEYIIVFAIVIGSHYFLIEDIDDGSKKKVGNIKHIAAIIYITINVFLFFYFGKENFLYVSDTTINFELAVSLTAKLSLIVFDFILTLVLRKRLSRTAFFLHIAYQISPIIVAYIDMFFSTGMVFSVIALILFIDYITLSHSQDITILEQKQHLAEQEKRIAQEQTKIMISQIGPHFLYNSISSIMALCKTDPDKAVSGLGDFSDYLRENMRFITVDKPISFERELTHVKTYVRLELLRFGDKLNMIYDIEETNFLIPALTVQPLVENAIKHGIGQRESGGTVKLITRRVPFGIIIQIADDGVGIYKVASYNKPTQKEHVGIENVTLRIKNMCNGTLTIDSIANVGTTATILLPLEKSEIGE